MELEKELRKINDDDLKTMFQTASVFMILKDLSKAATELEQYLKYDVPVWLGDIIEFQNSKYCVTCVYTDNSVDILDLGENASKRNVGLYKKEVKVIDKLQVIKEG